MPTLSSELDHMRENFNQYVPESVIPIANAARLAHQGAFNPSERVTISPGSPVPAFTLPNAVGEPVSSASLLDHGGPLLITFYRGSWCPYCNLTLHHLQLSLPAFRDRGCRLVAISPQVPDASLSTAEKQGLEFEVLSDVGNGLARQLGIVWKMPGELGDAIQEAAGEGRNMEALNGDDSLEVPVPANVLVDKDGVVRNVHVDPDYTRRLEPTRALEWVDAL